MKTRDSGMPDESLWSSFFRPEQTLAKLGLTPLCRDAADLGCGYGTFTIPAARVVRGAVHALDIDPDMVAATADLARDVNLTNVHATHRDFMDQGTGLPDAAVDYVMLFNILHCEQPHLLLREARRILSPAGRLAVIHWNPDPTTPRGPDLAIRPTPEQCLAWAQRQGFRLLSDPRIDLPPYHYGLVLTPA